MKRYPIVLTIAGSDSGGGAGIQADLKTIAALGAFGTSALTALTAQNTQGVQAIHPVPPDFLRQQLEAVFEDFTIDSVKIGMINTREVATVIGQTLDQYSPRHVVFDPVMVATSGAKLIQNETIAILRKELFSKLTVLTPNLDEAQLLVRQSLGSVSEMQQAAEELVAQGCAAVLLKGGHLPGREVYDILAQSGKPTHIFQSEFIPSKNLHGTGCTLSSAIATFLALGLSLFDAVDEARNYVAGAILAGKDVQTGGGHGPLNHSFAPREMQYKESSM
ncbi:bifunctional hydroxymethylpyrimidine kinase/phosphomethylpyrimidine kinase [Arundinibacter roseus]|uniref:hydroxymethylpyrimidine kinase n=1 Tax=Arundinibacter roseus TaxID=2070510 RepID=A0A4R4KJH9_9BACT|nr:bifunctional hydroxymethylpyrimidine kinase/phosphomethylpyrimidine kinase [Arundinibacter roseus]TDB68103.1 bifunctional hydroxymethylpyrimidine kinase/phosphomethylpyrimidine kinase [Arundinibacter roseus]